MLQTKFKKNQKHMKQYFPIKKTWYKMNKHFLSINLSQVVVVVSNMTMSKTQQPDLVKSVGKHRCNRVDFTQLIKWWWELISPCALINFNFQIDFLNKLEVNNNNVKNDMSDMNIAEQTKNTFH